jgi:hypothetical protein
MLVAFVSLRVFRLRLRGYQVDLPRKYRRYITKASRKAPHLESFAIQYVLDPAFHCKRVNAKWVVCDDAEYPAL